MASMENSAGALDDAYAIYANSIQKHVDSLKAVFQDLSQTMISSDVAKFIVDLGTIALTTLQKLQEGLNVFGGILPSIIGIVVGLLARTGAIAKLFSTIKGIAESALALRTAFSLMKSGSMAFSVVEILGALSPASIGIIVAAVAALGFALYNLAESSSNGTKSLSDLRNEANDAKQEFEDMQQKVDETKSRIKELQKLKDKGLITEAQQEELTLLTSQNELYTQQLELLRRVSKYKQGRVKQAEHETAQQEFDAFLRYDDQRMARFDASRAEGPAKRAIEANQSGIAGLLNTIADYNEARHELQSITDEILASPESDTSKIEEYEDRIAELNTDLQGYTDSLSDFYTRLVDIRGNLADKESIQQVDEWLGQIDDTLGRSRIGKTLETFKQDLKSLSRETRNAITTGKKWKDLTEDQQAELIKLGYSAEDAERYIEQLSSAQEDVSSSTVNTSSSVENLVSLSDEASNAIAMLEALQKAMGSDMGAAADQFKQVYARFKEDWESGKTGSENVRLAIELFIPESVKQQFHYDGQVLGELLASGIYEAVWGGENDPATNAANCIREHANDFGDALRVIENEDGSFSIEYSSIEGMADALGLSVTATEALIANMSEYGMQIGLSREAAQQLAQKFGLIEGNVLKASENMDAIKNIIETMAGDGKTGLEIQQTLEMFEQMGLIDLSGAQGQVDTLISTAILSVDEISKLHDEVDKINTSGASATEKVQALVSMFQEQHPEADAGTITSWIEQLKRAGEIDLDGLSGDLSASVQSAMELGEAVGGAASAIEEFPDTVTTEFTDNGSIAQMIKSLVEARIQAKNITDDIVRYFNEQTDGQFSGVQRFFGMGAGGEGTIGTGLDGNLRDLQEYRDNVQRISDEITRIQNELDPNSPTFNPWSADVDVAGAYYRQLDDLTIQLTNAQAELNAAVNANAQVYQGNVLDAMTEYVQAKADLESAEAQGLDTTGLQADVEAAEATLLSALQDLDAFAAENPEVELTALDSVSPVVSSVLSDLATLPSFKQISIVARYSTIGSIPGHAGGTKNAEGGPTLVNELGPELISDNGVAYIAGGGKPAITNLNPGAIVLNAEDTRRALAGSRRDRVFQAFANGTTNALFHGKRIHARAMYAVNMADSGGGGKKKSVAQSLVDTTKKVVDSFISAFTFKKTDTTKSNTGSSGGGGGGGGGSPASTNDDKKKVDWIEVAINRLTAAIDSFSKVFESGTKKFETRMNGFVQEATKIREGYTLYQQGYDRYIQEANSVGLDASLAERVRNGAIDISEYDKDTQEKIKEYQEWYEKALDCKEAIDDLHQSLADLYTERFSLVQQQFEQQLEDIEREANKVDLVQRELEVRGLLGTTRYYAAVSEVEKQNIAIMESELAELQKYFDDTMLNGEIEEGSEAYYEMLNAINDVKESIADARVNLLEYNKEMRQVNWDNFDYLRDRISQITDETKFLVDLMSNSKLLDDNGQLTAEGRATIGLHATAYDVYMQQADEYFKEMQRIEKEIANDPYNTDLIARREELLGLQQDSILAAEDEKQAIVSLVEEGIQAELDSVKDLIDARKDELDSAKDLYEYQKKISSKTADIASIQKQLAAYANDTSEENRARIQKLTQQLNEAQEDLQETEYDRYISDQKDLLDDLYEEYEDMLNARLDDVDALIEDMIAMSNANAEEISGTIESAANAVGYSVTEALSGIWNSSGGAYLAVTKYGDNLINGVNVIESTLKGIQEYVAAMVQASGVQLSSSVKQYATGGLVNYTGLAKLDGTPGKPELVLNSADTQNFILLRDAMRELAKNGSILSQLDSASYFGKLGALSGLGRVAQSGASGNMIGEINIPISIEHVDDYNDFIRKVQSDKKFEQIVQAMTTGRAMGGMRLEKRTF